MDLCGSRVFAGKGWSVLIGSYGARDEEAAKVQI
jgi:hypothetical protein